MKIKALFLSLLALPALATSAVAGGPSSKLESDLAVRAAHAVSSGHSRVIVSFAPGQTLPAAFQEYARTDRLDSVEVQVLDVPDTALASLAAQPGIAFVGNDRRVSKEDFRTDISSGSFFANRDLHYTGKGITVAVIDSGVDATSDDLRRHVVAFVDFVNHQRDPYDDNGHGTHVAGIIAGDGTDSRGEQAGIAPAAQIVALKVLDANGQGNVGDVIAAFDWIAKYGKSYNIKVVNVSLGAVPSKSFDDDPLTLAAKKVVEQGITVVAAAGNRGRLNGRELFGGITAPGNAPWVLTVGASSSLGTVTRGDDVVAGFSSRGPTRWDHLAKPDVVAGGVGIISTAAAGSVDYAANPQFLLPGAFPTPTFPYEVMTGTSMAAPAVTGTLALMLEANPALTPNFAKALVEYAAQWNPTYSALEQGAGFLNALGAVRLAEFYAHAEDGDALPVETIWSRHINWGNERVGGGVLVPAANAFWTTTTWGVPTIKVGDDSENIVWGTDDENIIWGTADDENIIWGTDDNGNIVWGTAEDDGNIVWGTSATGEAFTAANPPYVWFLNKRHDAIWVTHEFGDVSLNVGRNR